MLWVLLGLLLETGDHHFVVEKLYSDPYLEPLIQLLQLLASDLEKI